MALYAGLDLHSRNTGFNTFVLGTIRWTILTLAFLFAAFLFGISKEFSPPSAVNGAVRGLLAFLFMVFVWNATKKIGNKENRIQKTE